MAFSRRSPCEAPALFDIDPESAEDLITGFAGLTLVMEAYHGLGVGQSANQISSTVRLQGCRRCRTAEAEHSRVRDGADSFVIEDGWIVAQTIHYTVEEK